MATATLTRESKVRFAAPDPWHAHNTSSHIPNAELQKVMDDVERGIGIFGTFATAKEAMAAMRKAMEELEDEGDDTCTP